MAAKICVCHHGTGIVYLYSANYLLCWGQQNEKIYYNMLEYINMFYIRKRDCMRERMRIIRICH
jgi:hypothetical protein